MFGPAFQVLIAVCLVVIMFVIGFAIYNMEKVRAIQQAGRLRKVVPIYDGIKDLKDSDTFDTMNPLNPAFRDMSYSVNQHGGAEYSYNFWMYINKDTAGAIGSYYKDANNTTSTGNTSSMLEGMSNGKFVLMLRGVPLAVKQVSKCNGNTPESNVLVKQPMIYLTNNLDAMVVELNTMDSPEGVINGTDAYCGKVSNDWESINSYKVGIKNLTNQGYLNGEWFMVTLVVRDTLPTDPIPMRNRVHVQMFINGSRLTESYLDGKLGDVNDDSPYSVLRMNQAHLHVAPTIYDKNGNALSYNLESVKSIMMADLTYFNYAMEPAEIQTLFRRKFNKKYAATPATSEAPNKKDPLNAEVSNIQMFEVEDGRAYVQSLNYIGKSS